MRWNIDYEVVFKHNKLFDKIVMKMISNGQIIFYETVTDEVLKVAEEYNKEIKRLQDRVGEIIESFFKLENE